jgi:5-methylcytosine-specific restriction endonuclease McrA
MSKDIFPIWNPTKKSLRVITSRFDLKKSYLYFRRSSSAFIKKKVVRDIILKKSGYKCVNCFSIDNLQIDHADSVLKCFNNQNIYYCNTYENLQVLCMVCNTKKLP